MKDGAVGDLWNNAGKFVIDREMLLSLHIKTWKAICEKACIIDAELDILTNKITYTALSGDFDYIEIDEVTPYYDLNISRERDGYGRKLLNVEVEFERVENDE